MDCYNCVLQYQVLQNSKYCSTNLIFKKVQRALEDVLAGTFLPPGSGLATPGLYGKRNDNRLFMDVPKERVTYSRALISVSGAGGSMKSK